MATQHAARQIVAIQTQLVTERLPVEQRNFMLREQAEMWDREFPGEPFERIARQAQKAAPLGA